MAISSSSSSVVSIADVIVIFSRLSLSSSRYHPYLCRHLHRGRLRRHHHHHHVSLTFISFVLFFCVCPKSTFRQLIRYQASGRRRSVVHSDLYVTKEVWLRHWAVGVPQSTQLQKLEPNTQVLWKEQEKRARNICLHSKVHWISPNVLSVKV